MKFNKWTVGLAAVGLVSLTSAARAEEKSMVATALAGTSLSGYVDTSAQWNFGTGNQHLPPYKFGGSSKADGFNLNVVQLRIEKPLDEAEWAAGYRVDLWAGPDANTLGTQSILSTGSSDFAVRQAYVALRMPVCNGIDWKIGVFDSIIGYESVESPSNPNFTRSYGHSIEPQTHTGILASYRFNELISISAGVADTVNSSINSRAFFGSTGGLAGGFFGTIASAIAGTPVAIAAPGSNPYAESYKSYMGSVALTAPENWGFLSGSTLYGGVVNGYNNSALGSGVGLPQLNAYAGTTIATPLKELRLGAAFDVADFHSSGIGAEAWTVAGYASFQATEKLSLHARGEYVNARVDTPVSGHEDIVAFTGTVQYDLWKNVLTRLEFRWDRSVAGPPIFGGDTPGLPASLRNAFMLAGNIVYKF
jgi:hypothetical protein